jgi:hypothetical protein
MLLGNNIVLVPAHSEHPRIDSDIRATVGATILEPNVVWLVNPRERIWPVSPGGTRIKIAATQARQSKRGSENRT